MPTFKHVNEIKSFINNHNIHTLHVYTAELVYLGSYLANYPENKLCLEDDNTLRLHLYKVNSNTGMKEATPFTITTSSLKQLHFGS